MGRKILQIGNYPPPMCGWAIQAVLLDQELRRRGHVSAVLNVNESRKIKSRDYVDVQNSLDFACKVLWFSSRGYRIHAHLNAESYKLYLMDLFALSIGRLFGRPAALTFHGGLPQKYFPKVRPRWLRWAFQLVFHLAGCLTCDSEEIKRAIMDYGIRPGKILAVPCFSAELLDFRRVALGTEVDRFLQAHDPVFLCYVSFRPEYRLPVLQDAMKRFRARFPRAGFIWLGFPMKELPAANGYVDSWPSEEREGVALLGNLGHDEFLTLLTRCFACIRTPACDGISASVLESLALGVPVIAAENGRRPQGVITYSENDAADLVLKLAYLVENYEAVKGRTRLENARNNTSTTADWILGEISAKPAKAPIHVAE
jgi:glycosyltransferase involved in cell wall biosynthesis